MTCHVDDSVNFEAVLSFIDLLEVERMSRMELIQALKAGHLFDLVAIRPGVEAGYIIAYGQIVP